MLICVDCIAECFLPSCRICSTFSVWHFWVSDASNVEGVITVASANVLQSRIKVLLCLTGHEAFLCIVTCFLRSVLQVPFSIIFEVAHIPWWDRFPLHTHELHSFTNMLPLVMLMQAMMTTSLTQSFVITTMMCSEGTCSIELLFYRTKPTWHIMIVATVRSMGDMIILANVDGSVIFSAVVSVVTEWLHATTLAVFDVVISE